LRYHGNVGLDFSEGGNLFSESGVFCFWVCVWEIFLSPVEILIAGSEHNKHTQKHKKKKHQWKGGGFFFAGIMEGYGSFSLLLPRRPDFDN
jgi:hypothetical protein